ncbi:Protein atonal protein [Fasciola hepatica]|uniref:Protein atonal protein n=1 Tax=Fasciola hepatica TaxID=6192 RepID=A0A4E0RAE4_FASHE|nr:Protein atonal protein [Fasciola hepatica]
MRIKSRKFNLDVVRSFPKAAVLVPPKCPQTTTESITSYLHNSFDSDVPLALVTRKNTRPSNESTMQCGRRSRASLWTTKHAKTTTRRIKANARERIRVQTITDAFNRLRQIVPCYPTNPRPSKLSVLRTAKGYIVALTSWLMQHRVDCSGCAMVPDLTRENSVNSEYLE